MESIIPSTIPLPTVGFSMNPSLPISIVSLPINDKTEVKPMAPLVTAVWSQPEINMFFVRITAFIDSDYSILNPNGPELAFGLDYEDILKFYVFYSMKEKATPSYTAWYFEFNFQMPEQTLNKKEIEFFTFNKDPKTSRGTKTIVSSALGYI